MKEEMTLGLQLKQTSKTIKKYVQNKIENNFKEHAVHITLSEGMIMHYVYKHSDEIVTAKTLIARFSLSKATMSQTLTSLLRKGLIHYDECKNDGRMKRIILSKKAEKLESDINQSLTESDAFFKDAFTEEEFSTFITLLDKLRQHVSTALETK